MARESHWRLASSLTRVITGRWGYCEAISDQSHHWCTLARESHWPLGILPGASRLWGQLVFFGPQVSQVCFGSLSHGRRRAAISLAALPLISVQQYNS